MSILVTGGTGYIGAHVVHQLIARGDRVVIVDDLATGLRERVPDVPIVVTDLAGDDAAAVLERTMVDYAVDSVIHFAGRKQVGESVEKPLWYYAQNVGGMATLLAAAERCGVRRIVFSSSAAVYGTPDDPLIAETAPCAPVNPYGETKLVGEWMLQSAARRGVVSATSLRYFNVAGAGRPELGDTAVLNLIPMVFERLERGEPPMIFGDDYATPDGTCIRDFIHVSDLADAHLLALDALDPARPGHSVYNVGTGLGSSVRDVVDTIARVTGSNVAAEVHPRRAGDPAQVVADASAIVRDLGWSSRHTLDEMVTSAWQAWQARPRHTSD